MSENNVTVKSVPALALRGICVLPGMVVHFDVSRKRSIRALEQAMTGNQEIFLVVQKDENEDEPQIDDLFQMGVLAEVKQIVRMPDKIVRVLVSVRCRAWMLDMTEWEGSLQAKVREVMPPIDDLEDRMRRAMIDVANELYQRYLKYHSKVNKGALRRMTETNNLYEYLEGLSVQLPLTWEQQQEFLEAYDGITQYEMLTKFMSDQIEKQKLRKSLMDKAKAQVEKNQREYIIKEQMRFLKAELGEENDPTEDGDEFLEKVQDLQANDEVKEKITKSIKRFKMLPGSSSEANVERTYIETLLELPWDKVIPDNLDAIRAERILNEDHYGLEKVKERIVEFLAVKQFLEKTGKEEQKSGTILCLVGPPGTGKTSIVKSIAKSMERKYVRICLGGVRDEAEIRGHRKTYVGAMPGRIVNAMKQAECANPVILLDEIDKMANDVKGDPASALLEVLDGEQNNRFVDHYVEVPMDLSKVMFIATANSLQTIPKPLLDRMEVIEVSSYTFVEKYHIAKDYLVKKQMEQHGLDKKQFSIQKKALEKVILNYTKEAGVRTLERTIGKLCRKATKQLLSDENQTKVVVTDKNLKEYLGVEKYRQDKTGKKAEVGVVHGLAWTSVGGVTLDVEVNTMHGKGELILTGKLGDVMKESARISLTLVRSLLEKNKNIAKDYFAEHAVHIHSPEGAVPKDGPSAGVTMTTAIYSAVTGIAVRQDVAMTGEVTLRGKVLAIGGLKEKILAAKTAGIKTVIIPQENEKDLEEIPAEITDGLEIIPVKQVKEVLEIALVGNK